MRIGSRSLGEFPSAVVHIECQRCGQMEATALTACWRGSARTRPCPTSSWRWPHAIDARISLGPAARGSRTRSSPVSGRCIYGVVKSSAVAFGAHESGKAHGNAQGHDPARTCRGHRWVGLIAEYCIAQLLNEGWRARTTVRNLGAAQEVRATIGKITANASAIEFMAADLNSDVGWADASRG